MFAARAKKCDDLERRVNERVEELKRRVADPSLADAERAKAAAALDAYEREVRAQADAARDGAKAQEGK